MESIANSFYDGIWHIVNWPKFEFLLFVVAIAALATFKDWKKLLVISLVFTLAFLIGILLAHFNVFDFKASMLLMVQSVLLMVLAIFNFTPAGKTSRGNFRVIAGGLVGLVGGLSVKQPVLLKLLGENFLSDLPAFMLGVEAGVLGAILFILVMSWLVATAFGMPKRDWTLILSGAVIGIALTLLMRALF